MSETTETPPGHEPHMRTPEQHEAVRRRAVPLALAGVILGVLGVVLLYVKEVGVHHPPNIVAVNMSFCAMMIAVGIFFYSKGTPGTGAARVLCLFALLSGLVGPFLFSKQTIEWRKGTEGRELENAGLIAKAAGKYAGEHEGKYPAGLAALLEENYLVPENLLSPFAGTAPLEEKVGALRARLTEAEVAGAIEKHSDYTYAGGDLAVPAGGTVAREVLVSYAKNPVMRKHLAVAFADGTARFITLDEAEAVLGASNKARAGMGLPELRRPESVERALKEAGGR